MVAKFNGNINGNKIGKKFYKLPNILPINVNTMNANEEDIGETTTLTPATTKSTSMRATVPMSIIKQFNLQAGDKLSWKLKAEDGKLVIIVRPIKNADR